MNGELTTAIDESSQSSQTVVLRRRRSIRLVGIGFGIFCYVSCAAIYFLSPSNPVLSLGRARFTVDALLELVFTLLALPAFGFAYFYGIRRHEVNPDFAFPEFAIDNVSSRGGLGGHRQRHSSYGQARRANDLRAER